MTIGLWNFASLLLGYSIVSLVLLLSTVAGWAVLYTPAIWAPFFLVAYLLAIISTFKVHARGVRTLHIPRAWLLTLLVLQLLTLLFNIGDCGDSPGTFLFLERIMVSSNFDLLCGSEPTPLHAFHWVSLPLFISFMMTYLYTVGKTFWMALQAQGMSPAPVRRLYVTTLVIISVIIALFFVWPRAIYTLIALLQMLLPGI